MYKLMHKHTLVLEVENGQIIVHEKSKLPFDLRHKPEIGYADWLNYLKRRVSSLQRTYMNQLYKQRRLGRGHVEVINDSCAISPVDLFWITADHIPHKWEDLQRLKDISMDTALVTLDGILDGKTFMKDKIDHVSILTTKGAFKKAVYKSHILKKGDNAEYEVSAYKLGYKLGFDVAEAELFDGDKVACKLFTNDRVSLVHALEFLYDFDVETYKDMFTIALSRFKSNAKIYGQLQRLFLFNYLVTNNDLHGENFGFLYDTETFEITGIAPAFDFNSAFEEWDNIDVFDPTLFPLLGKFANDNIELVQNLVKIKEILATDRFLNDKQKNCVISRAEYLMSLLENT